jgi:hypothetical protein
MFDDLSLDFEAPIKLSTGEIWFKALSSPRVESYRQFINQEDSSAGTTLYWLFLAGGFGGLAAGLLQAAFNSHSFFGLVNISNGGEVSSGAILWAFFGALLFSVGVPLVTLINTGLIQIIIRAFGDRVSFERLLYVFAAYQAPLGLLICFIGGIPTLGCVSLPLLVYWLVLGVVAIRSVSQLEIGKAIVCTLAPLGLGGMMGICAVVVLVLSSIQIL